MRIDELPVNSSKAGDAGSAVVGGVEVLWQEVSAAKSKSSGEKRMQNFVNDKDAQLRSAELANEHENRHQ